MRGRWILSLAVGASLVLVGCASNEEWRTWREHPTHFASGDHLSFSVRNTEGSPPRLTQRQFVMARDEGWWGKPVTVSQEQILQR